MSSSCFHSVSVKLYMILNRFSTGEALMDPSLAEIPQRVVETLRKSSELTDEEIKGLEEKLLSEGKRVSLRSVKIRREGDEYSGLDIDSISSGISLVLGNPQTGKTMSFKYLLGFFEDSLQKQVEVETTIEVDGNQKLICSQENGGFLSDICDLEKYYHFIEQYDQHSSILYPKNKDELDSQNDMHNLMLAIQPGGSHGAERLLSELVHDLNRQGKELQERMMRHTKEEKQVEATLEDVDSFLVAFNEALEIASNEELLEKFLEKREEFSRLCDRRRDFETKASSKKRYRSYLRSESSKFDRGDVNEILLDILKSMSCSVCGSDVDLTQERMVKAKGRASCPMCDNPFDWKAVEEQAKKRASRITSIRDELFALDDEISNLEKKLRDLDEKIESLGYSSSLSRIEPELVDKSRECLEKLTAMRERYVALASMQEKKLGNIRSKLEKERELGTQVEERLFGIKKTVESIKAAVSTQEDNLKKEFVELANRNLISIRGQDDWFLMPEENRLKIIRAIQENGETLFTKRSFMSPPPYLHEGLRLAVCLSVSLAIIEMREELGTSNLSFVVIDSPDSLLTAHEMKGLIELLGKVGIPQVLLLTSRNDLGEECSVVARLESNPSILSRTELQKAKVDESFQTTLEFWGIRT